MSEKKTLVIVNGKLTDKISVFDHGFLYADGVFDTFRIFNGRPFFLDKHLSRLYRSAKNANIRVPLSRAEMKTKLTAISRKFNRKNAFVRLIVTRGVGQQGLRAKTKPSMVFIYSERDFRPLRKIRAAISSYQKISVGRFEQTKGLDYSLPGAILSRLEGSKVDEVIFLNELGKVSEASTANIFCVLNDKLFTPPLKSGALAGVTRQQVLKHFAVIEKEMGTRELLRADEVFLTGTVDLVTSLEILGKKKYRQFKIARLVYEKLAALAHLKD